MSAKIRSEFIRAARADQEKMAADAAASGGEAPKLVRHLPSVDIGEQIGELADTLGRLMSVQPIFVNGASSLLAEDFDGLLRPMHGPWFCSWIEQWCSPEKKNRYGDFFPTSMGKDLAVKVLSSGQFRNWIRRLDRERAVQLPVIREDGRLELLPVGYDEESRTWTRGEVEYRDDMTMAEAMRVIERWFSTWPWEGEGSIRSNANAAAAMAVMFMRYLDAMLRPSDLRPGCFVFGNRQGLGKTTLARMLLAPTQGATASRELSQGDRFALRVESALLSGSRVMFLDDLGPWLASPELNHLLTASDVSVRRFHTQDEVGVENTLQLVGTGVSTEISRDLARRVLVVNLALDEDVQGRKFAHEVAPDGGARDMAMRAELLAACWAITREAHSRGWLDEPPARRGRLAGFSRWSGLAGAMLEVGGLADPLTPHRIRQVSQSERDADMEALVEGLMGDVLPGGEVFATYGELADRARDMGVLLDLVGTTDAPAKVGRKFSDPFRAFALRGVSIPSGKVAVRAARTKCGRGLTFAMKGVGG